MATEVQKRQLLGKLKEYKSRYMKKQYDDLDESATRIMTNSLLTEVLGYKELEEIKTEYRIRGEYADYVIQLARKKRFIVEVKAIQLDLSDKHLRQSVNYAANEGIDWIILTNGRQLELYRVIFSKPIAVKKIFSCDLGDLKQVKDTLAMIALLTKRSVLKNELDSYWTRFKALDPENLCKNFYSAESVKLMKRMLKKDTGLNFSEDDIFDSIHNIIVTKIDTSKPRFPCVRKKKEKRKKEVELSSLERNTSDSLDVDGS